MQLIASCIEHASPFCWIYESQADFCRKAVALSSHRAGTRSMPPERCRVTRHNFFYESAAVRKERHRIYRRSNSDSHLIAAAAFAPRHSLISRLHPSIRTRHEQTKMGFMGAGESEDPSYMILKRHETKWNINIKVKRELVASVSAAPSFLFRANSKRKSI